LATTTPVQPDQPVLGPIAPAWHTVVVLLVLFGLSGLSAHQHGLVSFGWGGRTGSYVLVMALEWLLTGFIWWSIRRRGIRLRDLIGGSWPSAWAVLRDLGIAVLYLIGAGLVLAAIGFLIKADGRPSLRNILPNGCIEVSFYIMLSFTAGICEEILCRGYLQMQFTAWTKSTAAGMILQGVAFGLGHGYQGPRRMCFLAVYGCLFGLLAYWRRSLRPGMVAHFMQDAIAGLVGGHFMK
jgi:CAAX protease family protein